MSDDPFEQKKVRTIRTGRKIIAKSRAFEKDNAIMANRTCDIKVGSVEEKSAWLSGAFKHEGTGDDSRAAASSIAEKKVIRPYQTKSTKKEEEEANELKSVKDKKEWLSNAFTKKGSDSSSAMHHQAKSTEWQPIQQTRSFEVNNHHYDTTPSIVKSVSVDNHSHHEPIIHQTKSYDHGEESSSPEYKLKSVRDKKEWLSNAFSKKEVDKGVIVGHRSKTSSEVQYPRHESTNPTQTLYQTKSLEMDHGKPAPSIEKYMSAENTQHVPMIQQTKSFDGSMKSRPFAATAAAAAAATTATAATATNIEKDRGGATVSLYQKKTSEDKTQPKETRKTVKDKQAWLSSAFKTASSSSTPATIGGAIKQHQQQTKGVVTDRHIAVDRSANATSVERQSAVAKAKPRDESKSNEEADLEKMSVAERAKWLKMAFK